MSCSWIAIKARLTPFGAGGQGPPVFSASATRDYELEALELGCCRLHSLPSISFVRTTNNMASKKSKLAPTDEELLAQFEDLGTEGPASKPTKTGASKSSAKHTLASAQSEQDLLAELGNLATQRAASRPSTPSLKSTTAASVGARSPKRTSTTTPTPGGRSSEERSATGAQPRKSGESTRSFHQSITPATTEESPEPEHKPVHAASTGGGGWWGGLLSTATAAVSQAQAVVKEIQKNDEAQRWAEQMRGNVGALKGFGALSDIPTSWSKADMTSRRWRSPLPRIANLPEHPSDHCSSDLLP